MTDPAAIRAHLKLWSLPVRTSVVRAQGLGIFDGLCATGFAAGLALTLDALRTHQAITLPLLILSLSLVVRAAIGYSSQRLNQANARRIIHDLRLNLLAKAMGGRGLSQRQMHTVTGLFEPTEALEGYYARFVPARGQATIVPLLLIGVVAFIAPLCALILLFTLVPFILLMALSGMATASESRRQLDALTRLSVLFADRLRSLSLILSFEAAPAQVKTVARAAHEVSERTLSVLKRAFTGSAVLEFFAALSVALIAVYCGFYLLGLLPFHVPGWLDFHGHNSHPADAFAAAFFVLALSPEIYLPMRRLSAAYHEQQQATRAAEVLIDLETQLAVPVLQPLHLDAAPALHFASVTCRFADDPDYALGPLSFTAPAGSLITLSGPSGVGKSTFLRLLLGVSPQQGLSFAGDIRIGDHVLTPNDDLSPSLSWMSQHTPILAGTLRDNLTLGSPVTSESEIARICTLTGLDALIATREGGLKTRLDERGSGLSGGERRRIGLARALLKPAPLLILDEPTADLDADSEAAILTAIQQARTGRTVLIATHSDALIALADIGVSL